MTAGFCRTGWVEVSRTRKSRPALHSYPSTQLYCENLKEKKGKCKENASINGCKFLARTKKKGKGFILASFFCGCLCAPVFRPIRVETKFSTLTGHMIKCLLTEFTGLGPYVMTLS